MSQMRMKCSFVRIVWALRLRARKSVSMKASREKPRGYVDPTARAIPSSVVLCDTALHVALESTSTQCSLYLDFDLRLHHHNMKIIALNVGAEINDLNVPFKACV